MVENNLNPNIVAVSKVNQTNNSKRSLSLQGMFPVNPQKQHQVSQGIRKSWPNRVSSPYLKPGCIKEDVGSYSIPSLLHYSLIHLM